MDLTTLFTRLEVDATQWNRVMDSSQDRMLALGRVVADTTRAIDQGWAEMFRRMDSVVTQGFSRMEANVRDRTRRMYQAARPDLAFMTQGYGVVQTPTDLGYLVGRAGRPATFLGQGGVDPEVALGGMGTAWGYMPSTKRGMTEADREEFRRLASMRGGRFPMAQFAPQTGPTAAGMFGALGDVTKGVSSGLDSMVGGAARLIVPITAITAAFVAVNMASRLFWGTIRAGRNIIESLASAFQSAGQYVVTLGMEFEQTRVAFEVFTGSAVVGNHLLEELQRLAISTPYNFRQMTSISQMLLGMGVPAEDLVAVVGRLGDIAGGSTERLQRLALAYGQVFSAGRFYGTELRQFTEAGVGVEDFAKTMGVTGAQLRNLMKEGLVDRDLMIDTINRLTNAGGRFADLSVRQAQTVGGAWSNVQDAIQLFAMNLGERLFKEFNLGPWLANLTQEMQKMAPGLFDQAVKGAEALRVIVNDIWSMLKGWGQEIMGASGGVAGMVPTLQQIRDFLFDAAVSVLTIAKAAYLKGQGIGEGASKLATFWANLGTMAEYGLVPITGPIEAAVNATRLQGIGGPGNLEMTEEQKAARRNLWTFNKFFGKTPAGPEKTPEETIFDRMINRLEGTRLERRAEEIMQGPPAFLAGFMEEQVSGIHGLIGKPAKIPIEVQGLADSIRKEMIAGVTDFEKFNKTNQLIDKALIGTLPANLGKAGGFLGRVTEAGFEAAWEGLPLKQAVDARRLEMALKGGRQDLLFQDIMPVAGTLLGGVLSKFGFGTAMTQEEADIARFKAFQEIQNKFKPPRPEDVMGVGFLKDTKESREALNAATVSTQMDIKAILQRSFEEQQLQKEVMADFKKAFDEFIPEWRGKKPFEKK